MTGRVGDAGCLPITKDGRVVLISSRKKPGQFVFPKGGVHEDEDPSVAAQRETIEEAGVSGNVIGCLGVIKGCQWFILEVDQINDQYLEMHQRQRQILTIEEARQRTDLRPKARDVLLAYIAPNAENKD